MKVKLPAQIEELKDGLYKRDVIKHYKKELRKNARNRSGSNKKLYL